MVLSPLTSVAASACVLGVFKRNGEAVAHGRSSVEVAEFSRGFGSGEEARNGTVRAASDGPEKRKGESVHVTVSDVPERSDNCRCTFGEKFENDAPRSKGTFVGECA